MLAGVRAKLAGPRNSARVGRERHFEVQLREPIPGQPALPPDQPTSREGLERFLAPFRAEVSRLALLVFDPERVARYHRFLRGATAKEGLLDPVSTFASWANSGVDPERWLTPTPERHPSTAVIDLSLDQLQDWPLLWWAGSPYSGAALILEAPVDFFLSGSLFPATFDPGCTGGEISTRDRAVRDHGKQRTARSRRIALSYDDRLRISLVGSGPVLTTLFHHAVMSCSLSRLQWAQYAPRT